MLTQPKSKLEFRRDHGSATRIYSESCLLLSFWAYKRPGPHIPVELCSLTTSIIYSPVARLRYGGTHCMTQRQPLTLEPPTSLSNRILSNLADPILKSSLLPEGEGNRRPSHSSSHFTLTVEPVWPLASFVLLSQKGAFINVCHTRPLSLA